MNKIKKYLALAIMLLALPLLSFIATHFVLESNKDIYALIPEESDLVIEINTRNFINEIAYQRVFHEDYFHQKIVREEHAEPMQDIGVDPFSSIVVFREQWASKSLWMVCLGITNEATFEKTMNSELDGFHYKMKDGFALIQLTPYHDQVAVETHMDDILNGKVKSFKDRFDLTELFERSKEINCYIVPSADADNNQVLSGNISFDFLTDKIQIDGDFTPVSGFSETPSVAYALNEEAPFSLRSSLNLVKTIYWFSEDKIEGLPSYSQIAIDYEGMNLFMVDENLNYPFPFKQRPDLQAHFDIVDYNQWNSFLNKMAADSSLKIDTVAHILSTKMGTYFNYIFDKNHFAIARNELSLTPSTEENLYFALHMRISPILENIKLAIDEENPPKGNAAMLLSIIEGQFAELSLMSNIEHVHFEMRLEDETNMKATGEIAMIHKTGNSMIESMSFGSTAVLLLADLLSTGQTDDEELEN